MSKKKAAAKKLSSEEESDDSESEDDSEDDSESEDDSDDDSESEEESKKKASKPAVSIRVGGCFCSCRTLYKFFIAFLHLLWLLLAHLITCYTVPGVDANRAPWEWLGHVNRSALK